MKKSYLTAVTACVVVAIAAYAFELHDFPTPGSHPRVPFYISTNMDGMGPYEIPLENVVDAVLNAMNEWNEWKSDHSEHHSSELQFYYAGLTDIDYAAPDGKNVVFFDPGECPIQPGCAGYISYWPGGPTSSMAGFDVQFYGLEGVSGATLYWTDDPQAGWDADIWTVMLHEFGHALGLDHSKYGGVVMGTNCGTGCVRRHLAWDDIDGVLYLYGPYTNEGFWASSTTVAPGESFTLELDYDQAPGQQYQVLLDLTGDDGLNVGQWQGSLADSRILPLNGNFFPTENYPDVFLDFGMAEAPGGICGMGPYVDCRELDENGRATVTVNLPENAIELFGNDLHFAAVTWGPYINGIEDVSVGVHVQISEPCAEDIDDSGAVDTGDLLALLAAWGMCDDCPQDLDNSGDVGTSDLLQLLATWGPC